MPDVDERLGRVEQRLKTLGERMDEQFAKVDEQFAKVDERFAQVDERFAQVDERFAQVDERFAQVDRRFEQVDQRFGSLEAEVQKLRILGEQNTSDIKRIADVQAHHGEFLAQHGAALQRIEDAIAPLTVLPAAIQRSFRHLDDHERRITALEQGSRRITPET